MAYTVRRPNLTFAEKLYLPSIVAGLAITFKHLKNMLTGKTKVIMQYPEEKWDSSMPEHYRGAPTLVRDEHGRERCVACQLCEFICPPRAIRIKPAGGAGGHNGLTSIIELLGGEGFPRLRFGIGNDFPRGRQSEYVLGAWGEEERKTLKERIELASKAVLQFGLLGVDHVMNTFNKR